MNKVLKKTGEVFRPSGQFLEGSRNIRWRSSDDLGTITLVTDLRGVKDRLFYVAGSKELTRKHFLIREPAIKNSLPAPNPMAAQLASKPQIKPLETQRG